MMLEQVHAPRTVQLLSGTRLGCQAVCLVVQDRGDSEVVRLLVLRSTVFKSAMFVSAPVVVLICPKCRNNHVQTRKSRKSSLLQAAANRLSTRT